MQVRETFPPDILLLQLPDQLMRKVITIPAPLPALLQAQGAPSHLVVALERAQPPLILRQYWQRDFRSAAQPGAGRGRAQVCLPIAAPVPPGSTYAAPRRCSRSACGHCTVQDQL